MPGLLLSSVPFNYNARTLEGYVAGTKYSSMITSDHLRLRIVNCTMNKVLVVAVKRETNLGHVLKIYKERYNVQDSVSFVCDGTLVNYFDTPASLGLEDNNIIDVSNNNNVGI